MLARDTVVSPWTLDWLWTERLDEARKIMSDTGTYIQLPAIGSQAGQVTVFGEYPLNIERSLRKIVALVSDR